MRDYGYCVGDYWNCMICGASILLETMDTPGVKESHENRCLEFRKYIKELFEKEDK